MSEPTVEREVVLEHRCACIVVLTYGNGDPPNEDWCKAAAGPDQPLCDSCYTNGHHLLDTQKPWVERPDYQRNTGPPLGVSIEQPWA